MTTPKAYVLHRNGGLPDLPVTGTATLDYEGRFLRRRRIRTDQGTDLFVDLPETVSLNAGDAFETTEGKLITVTAAAEPLLEICATGDDLARLAWHVGNRHTPAQVESGRLLIRHDHIMGDMLVRLGATIRETIAPFNPEGGAYGHGRTHGHHHGGADSDPNAYHGHDHDHSHSSADESVD